MLLRCLKSIVYNGFAELRIKQKLLNNAIIAVYNGFDELIKNGYKKVSIVAASNCNYINGKKRIDVYKNYKWEVIRMKNEEGGKE